MRIDKISLVNITLGLFVVFAYQCNMVIAEEGLTAHYSFDTDKADDNSGNNLHGKIVGGPPELINGVEGKAWKFNGTLKVEMDYQNFKNARAELSMRCFIRPEDVNGINLIYEEGGAWTGYCVRIMDGVLEFAVVCCDANHPPYVSLSSELPDTDNWLDIASIYDKGTISLYVNGKKVDEESTEWAQLGAHGQAGGIGDKQGGDTAFGATSGFYIGDMDELKVYSRALQPGELSSAVSSMNKLATTWSRLKNFR